MPSWCWRSRLPSAATSTFNPDQQRNRFPRWRRTGAPSRNGCPERLGSNGWAGTSSGTTLLPTRRSRRGLSRNGWAGTSLDTTLLPTRRSRRGLAHRGLGRNGWAGSSLDTTLLPTRPPRRSRRGLCRNGWAGTSVDTTLLPTRRSRRGTGAPGPGPKRLCRNVVRCHAPAHTTCANGRGRRGRGGGVRRGGRRWRRGR